MTTTSERPVTAIGISEAAYGVRQPILLPEDWELTDERFEQICRLNPLSRFERTADGRLYQLNASRAPIPHIVAAITTSIQTWAAMYGGRVNGQGQYDFGDGRAMIPDSSWVTQDVLDRRTDRTARFTEAPALVVEVVSMHDDIGQQQAKMGEWIARGSSLGWLIDPWNETVYVYRASVTSGASEQLDRPEELSGEDICPGLVVPMQPLWDIEA